MAKLPANMIYQYLTSGSFDPLFNNGVKFVVKTTILFTKLHQTNDPAIKEKLKPLSEAYAPFASTSRLPARRVMVEHTARREAYYPKIH